MERGSSSTWVKGVLSLFATQGIDTQALLLRAGVPPQRLEQPDARLSIDEVSRIWELAVQESGNTTLGLDKQLLASHIDFDVVGYAMLASPSLRKGLEQLSLYMALISDATNFTLEPQGQDIWLVLGHTGNTRPIPRQRQEFSLLSVLVMCQWVARKPLCPVRTELAFPEPANRTPYLNAFGCDVRFAQPRSRMLVGQHDLDTPLPSVNPLLLDVHERVIKERMSQLGQSATSQRVLKAIIRCIDRGEPRREDIAACLALTERTLERRLREENTSFRRLLDAARIELAGNYLADERYPLNQVADLLGFVDVSNFFRACKRWFGMSPTQFRAQKKSTTPS